MKRTIINDDIKFGNLFSPDHGRKSDPDSTFLADNEKVEFYLHNDFGEKLDLTKESANFVDGIINRLMEYNNIDFEEMSFAGNRNSVVHFMSNLIDQYLRYKFLKSYFNQDGF